MRDLERLSLVALIAAASQLVVLGRSSPGLKKSGKIPTESTHMRGIRGLRLQDPGRELQWISDIVHTEANDAVGRRTQVNTTLLQSGDEGIIGGVSAQSGGMYCVVIFTA
jgi:hypothetical protein